MRIRVIDSHTGGEPTRLVISGFPDLGRAPLRERRARFRSEFDHLRAAIVNEPRGSDAIVGGLLCDPHDQSCQTGVIFFNNVSVLGMCGHGTIGLVATLAHLKRLEPGHIRIETPVGIVSAELHVTGAVTVRNVPSYRYRKDVELRVPGFGSVTGDIAWGGNWFFLVKAESPIELSLRRLDELTAFTWSIRQTLERHGITGEHGGSIDHIELCGPPRDSTANSRNFVLCPGKSYDRSPCGTGTSAKIACLYEDGKLQQNELWIQESITGSVFEAHIERHGTEIIPFIKGWAFVTSEADLIIDERDPFRWGIPA
ncbi:MAG: proline racemase family protein [Acidobacteriaceae bacterium]|nr:proline racemase family protein [Acidobacteriaceae bacterium]MBV9497841.1 proline racemase family protein [Acidobacteriaceae bacterium]